MKCHRYWPEAVPSATYGDFTVTFVHRDDTPECVLGRSRLCLSFPSVLIKSLVLRISIVCEDICRYIYL